MGGGIRRRWRAYGGRRSWLRSRSSEGNRCRGREGKNGHGRPVRGDCQLVVRKTAMRLHTDNIACLTRSDFMIPLLARFLIKAAFEDPEDIQAMAFSFLMREENERVI